ncbi:MAG: 3-phosphoshikimate 1-carboxyvinyltransferase [Candidatus Omnitrophica bacterium]|nr:3-phosphoshikimate 1-carboxyvinyltransferase [Candidatus Omnitrophota bacterium]
MKSIKINPIKKIVGSIRLKGDKSISHRTVMIASIAEGRSVIKNFLKSADCLYTVKAFQGLGVDIRFLGEDLIIEGAGLGGLKKPQGDIYLGNSGTSMRLISGILAGQAFETTLTGDESLSSRPMHRIIEPLRLMGARISAREDNFAPLTIKGGKLKAIRYKSKVASAQVKSAVMLAALYVDGVTELEEPVKSRDHTERMLSLFGAKMVIDDQKVTLYGSQRLKAQAFEIPGDISSAAFFITAALLLKGSELVIKDILSNRTRTGLLDALTNMGGDISIENKHFNGCEDICDITVKYSSLKGISIEKDKIPSIIDELPILMVAALFAEGDTLIKGAGELRVKETDRIDSMTAALTGMGADISVDGDDIKIRGNKSIKGAKVASLGDHRTAMALVVAALASNGESEINDIGCIDTSFPEFFDLMESVSVKN